MLVKGAPGINCVMFTHIFLKGFTVTWTISSLSQYGYLSASEIALKKTGKIYWHQTTTKHKESANYVHVFLCNVWITTVYPKKYAHGFCFAVLCCGYTSSLLHWHCGNLTIAPVPAKQPWWIWINTSCEFIMNDCITTTKQSTTKPCAYFLGYTVCRADMITYIP